MQNLEVYIDFKSPYAFIAKDPTYALEDQYGIEVDWYPLTLNIGSYLGTAKKNDSGKVVSSNRSSNQWLSVKYAYKDARRYANLRELTLKGTQKIWDTSLSAAAFMWVKRSSRQSLKQFIDISYERFWRRELDLEDMSVVKRLIKESDVDTSGFDSWFEKEGRIEQDEMQMRFLKSGIYGVPTYRIAGQTYFGREHLPRVRWHLEGEKGPYPDIANDSVLAEGVAR